MSLQLAGVVGKGVSLQLAGIVKVGAMNSGGSCGPHNPQVGEGSMVGVTEN